MTVCYHGNERIGAGQAGWRTPRRPASVSTGLQTRGHSGGDSRKRGASNGRHSSGHWPANLSDECLCMRKRFLNPLSPSSWWLLLQLYTPTVVIVILLVQQCKGGSLLVSELCYTLFCSVLFGSLSEPSLTSTIHHIHITMLHYSTSALERLGFTPGLTMRSQYQILDLYICIER